MNHPSPPNDVPLRFQPEWFRVTLASIGDAVITTDTESRVTFINPVAESLTGWTLEEAVGLSLESVFKIVNQETRQIVESPTARALRDGVIVGLANHTLLISKDGTERPIDDSASPIRNDKNEIAGVVLIFRDITERYRQEKAMADASMFADNIIATLREPFVVIEKSLRVKTANRAFYQKFHAEKEETEGRHLYDLGNGQWNIPPLRRMLDAVLADNNVVENYEVEHEFPAIGRKVMLLNGRRIHVPDNHSELILLAMEDISDRKRAQFSEQRLAAIVDSSDDAIISKTLEGMIQSWNAAAERLFGYTAEEAVGRHISILIPPDRLSEEDRIISRIRGGERVDHMDTVRLRKGGQPVQISLTVSPVRDQNGQIVGASKIVRDITDRKRLEQADVERLTAARLMSAIVDSSDDAIISKTLEGMIQSWNAAAERLFGYKAEEAVGQHVSILIPAERLSEEDQIIAQIRAGERVDHMDTVRLRKDGSPVQISLTVSPVREADGRIIGASKIARDITERKRLEDKLRHAAAIMSENDRRKNEFLAMLAHELRNPLAPIRNAVQVLRLTSGLSDSVQAASAMMERQISQMVRMVDDLLDVSRVNQGKIELRKGRIELASAVNHAVEAARTLAQCLDHDLTVTLPSQPIYLNADPTRLSQVVGNLLNNACKFTDKGGRISLTVERDGGRAVIRVRDNGIGISADKLPHIFDMFMQIDTSLERTTSGLGIGLTLVKSLVEMHGGTVEVASAGIGQGSEFVVHLPIMAAPPKPPTSEPTVSEPTTTISRRILVVDDNRDSADSLAMLLKLTGNETRTAYDGVEAVQTAGAMKPDVIFMDIGLPKLNGYEAARKVRDEPWGKKLVLVALTGWGQEDDRQKSREAGFDSHLVKPVDYVALKKLLAELPTTSR